MSVLTRAQASLDITSTIYTNQARLIEGDTVKYRLLNLVDSFINRLDDADMNGGYMKISSSGRVNAAFINSATPGGKFLRDDGSWAFVDMSAYLPLAGTQPTYPLTGAIEFATGTTAIWQDISTGAGFYEGIGDNVDLSAANNYSRRYYSDPASDGILDETQNSDGYASLSLKPAIAQIITLDATGNEGYFSLSAGGAELKIIEQATGYTTGYNIHYRNITVSSQNTSFAGLVYDAGTGALVATNQSGLSILHRDANDMRYALSVAGGYLPLSGGASMTGSFNLYADASSSMQPVTYQQLLSFTAGLFDLRGGYDASVNLFPSSGGSGSAGAIMKADVWMITVAGTLGGKAVYVGDQVTALIDSPGQTSANWSIISHDFGYTPVSNALNAGNIFVGNGSNVAAAVPMSGDASMSNTGVLSISKVAALTSNGFVKTTGGTGTLTVDTGTYYSYVAGTSQDGSLFYLNTGSTHATSSRYLVFDGNSLFIETPSTSAVSGIFFKDNTGISRGGLFTAGIAGTNFTGTSISSASALFMDATATYVQRGTTLYNVIGTAGTNMGTSLDSSYFRVTAIQNLGTSTTSTSTYIAGALISVGAIPVVGTGGYVASSFGSYNTRLLSTGLQTSYLSETAGLSGGSIVLRGYNAVAGSRQQLTLVNFDGDFVGNYTSTSLAKANTLAIFGSNTGHGANGTGTLVKNSDTLIFISGTTAANSASRHDATGFRIDSLANIHTSNTNLFSVVNATAGSFAISTAGIVTISANGAPLVVNSANGAQSQITLQQSGTTRGYIDSNSTYNFMTEGTGGANALRVNNSAITGTLDILATGVSVGNGDLSIGTAGKKLKYKTGTNAAAGTGTLSSGTVTISTTAVTASSMIFVTNTSSTNPLCVPAASIIAGTSFVVNGTGADTFNWWILEPF